jgi:hypothetical protein
VRKFGSNLCSVDSVPATILSAMSNAVASSGQWKDVTDLFKEATSELTNQAPMVHVESFSLLDSMSAVEVNC